MLKFLAGAVVGVAVTVYVLDQHSHAMAEWLIKKYDLGGSRGPLEPDA